MNIFDDTNDEWFLTITTWPRLLRRTHDFMLLEIEDTLRQRLITHARLSGAVFSFSHLKRTLWTQRRLRAIYDLAWHECERRGFDMPARKGSA